MHRTIALVVAALVLTFSSANPAGGAARPAAMTAHYAAAPLFGAGGGPASGAVAIVADSARLDVYVSVSGLRPGSAYSATIRVGTCGEKKPVAYGLPVLSANAGGTASLAARVAARALPFMGWYLTVTARDAAQTPVACGILFGPDLTVQLGPARASGVSGVAIVLGNMDRRGAMAGHDQGADVIVLTHGLPAGTVHAALLRAGACGGHGAITYRLTSLAADRNGNALAGTFLKNMQVLRPGMSLTIQDAQMRPVACGNVTGHMPSM